MATLLGRGDAAGYSVVIAFVILVSAMPVGMPVVTTTVLAIGAREMARHKAIVNRCGCSRPSFHPLVSKTELRPSDPRASA